MSNSLWPHGLQPARLLCPWDSPGKNTGVGSLSLLQGIFSNQWSNPGLSHCRWLLYHLSHQGSPRILKWVACAFLQRIFLTQELNWGLLHYRQILYQLSYQGSPSIIREVQIKLTMRYHLTPVRMAITKSLQIASVGGCREKGTFMHYW